MTPTEEKSSLDLAQILSDIETGVNLGEKFSSRVKWKDGLDTFDGLFLRIFHFQLRTLNSVRELSTKGNYVESFILLRAVFENYFLTLLMSKGVKYLERDETGRAIVKTGLMPEQGTGPPIPIYFFAFEEYDPEWHRLRRPYVQDFFVDEEAEKRGQSYHADLYSTFLTFGRIRRALKLNGVLDDALDARVEVHYNFLSSFVHVTSAGLERISGNVIVYQIRSLDELSKYDRLLGEQALLYLLHLLAMYLALLLDHFESRGHGVAGREDLERFIQLVELRYGYFWFIFNKPSKIDIRRIEEINFARETLGQPKVEGIRYYPDSSETVEAGSYGEALPDARGPSPGSLNGRAVFT